jgi:hypothetical protein
MQATPILMIYARLFDLFDSAISFKSRAFSLKRYDTRICHADQELVKGHLLYCILYRFEKR